MSTFLLFECDPLDQPASTDAVERLTWCSLRIRVGQRFVSRVWDKSLQSERTSLYVPAFPIAEWIVDNWWSLFNEPCRSEKIPTSVTSGAQLAWIKRHCLRSADSALMLPSLYLFHDGESLRVEWQSDISNSMAHMPGEFVAAGVEQLDANATRQSLGNFVDNCLDRVNVTDSRVHKLADQWRAIQGADIDEQQFCSLAGRMGIDPYDGMEMTEELQRFFERTITNPENPLVSDLTEVAQVETIVQQWSWLTRIAQELQLGPNPVDPSFELPPRRLSPPSFGYELAYKVRAQARIALSSPLVSVEEVVQAVMGQSLRFEDRNHAPGHGIRALVGRVGGDIVCAGPLPTRPDNRRFLIARSLYYALIKAQSSHRLVTDAYSWDQKASRAFAAELLAPQQALVERVSTSGADSDAIETLKNEFRVSAIVIEKQLENAGISISSD